MTSTNTTMPRSRSHGLLLLVVLLFSVYTLTNAGRLHIVDEASLFAVTESLGLRADVDTNAIAWTQWVNSPGEVLGSFGPDGQVYSKKGPAPAFMSVPWYLALRALTVPSIQAGMLQGTLLWNGLVTSLTAALLWLLAVRLRYADRTAATLGLLFGLTTIAWPYATLFFGEPLSAFGLVLALFGILSWKDGGGWGNLAVAGTGCALVLATVTAHAPLVAVLVGYAVYAGWHRRQSGVANSTSNTFAAALAFLVPLLVAGALLLSYNAVRFGSPFNTGYHFESGEGFTTPFLQGFWGLILSPYRSVFLHTPLFVASLVAIFPFTRRHRAEGIVIVLLSIALVTLYSLWWMWWGGYAWGPRFLVPLTPLWVLLLAPVVESFALRRNEGEPTTARLILNWAFAFVVVISFVVQLLAVSINFVNYETMLRTDFYTTDWADPLKFGPPAQSLSDFFLSPVFGQVRLVAAGGMAANSDLPWLWPDGSIQWMLLLVGSAALLTLGWLFARWFNAVKGDTSQPARLTPPMLVLAVSIPIILIATWLGVLGRDPVYGAEGKGYRAALADLCSVNMAEDAVVTVAPFGYQIPMNWLAPECVRGLPVFGYALDSMQHAEADSVMSDVLNDSDRIWLVTSGVGPSDPENSVERWLADNAYKADDRWFDDHRLLRYATPGALTRVQYNPHNLFLSDKTSNSVTIVASRVPPGAAPGQIIPTEIQYLIHSKPTADLRWFVQLLSPEGVAVAQLDTGPDDNYTVFTALPTNDLLTERAGLQLPADLPPGDYQVIAGLYNPNIEGSNRLRASDGREYLVLNTLTVAP